MSRGERLSTFLAPGRMEGWVLAMMFISLVKLSCFPEGQVASSQRVFFLVLALYV